VEVVEAVAAAVLEDGGRRGRADDREELARRRRRRRFARWRCRTGGRRQKRVGERQRRTLVASGLIQTVIWSEKREKRCSK